MFYIIFRFCDNVDVKTLTRKQSNSFEKDFTNFKIFSSFNHDGNILFSSLFLAYHGNFITCTCMSLATNLQCLVAFTLVCIYVWNVKESATTIETPV